MVLVNVVCRDKLLVMTFSCHFRGVVRSDVDEYGPKKEKKKKTTTDDTVIAHL